MTKKMSEIMLEMATTLLKDPVNPSSEAAHAALLFAIERHSCPNYD